MISAGCTVTVREGLLVLKTVEVILNGTGENDTHSEVKISAQQPEKPPTRYAYFPPL
jgi:hypothetical protein